MSAETIGRAALAIARVNGVAMDPASLLDDVTLLAVAFPEEDEYSTAIASTCRALEHLVNGSVTPATLKYALEGWQSYHYQPRVGQGERATCRIVFRRADVGIEVMAFGHRHIPSDLYERLAHRTQ